MAVMWIVSWSGIAASAFGQSVPYVLEPSSRLWLEGTATIGGYTCGTSVVTGEGLIDTALVAAARRDSARGDARLVVSVKMLDCGNSAMNRDMYEALKADRFRTIRFDVQGARIETAQPQTDGSFRVIAHGLLTVAGVSKETDVELEVRKLTGGRFDIEGHKRLTMRDFNIEPPTAFFGLIRADERLDVHFALIAAPQTLFGSQPDYSVGSGP